MIEELVRENIKKLQPYTSARDKYLEGILLDANENSLGTTAEEFKALGLNRYPDPHQKDLREAVGKYFSIPEENLFFGVGSDEIIDLLIRVFCEPGKDKVMILDPTYGMYKVACDINNVETISVNLNPQFQIDLNEVRKYYSSEVKVIFLCSPNNPTGNVINKNDILNLCSEFNSIVIIDEAYVDFAQDNSLIHNVQDYANLVVMRTFSKAWGLAGVRLGFCVANKEVINYLFKIKTPYNVNTLTRYAVIKSLNNYSRKDEFVKKLKSERERVIIELRNISGIKKIFQSDANYILFRCPNAKQIQKKLAEQGIIIRDRSSYKMLEDCLRLSIGTETENNKFLEAIKKLL
jgi:histidinol-phosphate aminotransferase